MISATTHPPLISCVRGAAVCLAVDRSRATSRTGEEMSAKSGSENIGQRAARPRSPRWMTEMLNGLSIAATFPPNS